MNQPDLQQVKLIQLDLYTTRVSDKTWLAAAKLGRLALSQRHEATSHFPHPARGAL